MLKAKQLPIPPPKPLGGSVLPNVFVGDEAFSLLQNLMRPYPSGNLTREKNYFLLSSLTGEAYSGKYFLNFGHSFPLFSSSSHADNKTCYSCSESSGNNS